MLVRLTLQVTPFLTADYTGKFVKTLLMAANPELGQVFEDRKSPTPKPIRITPLIDRRGLPVYPRAAPERPKAPPVPVQVGGTYHVYLGYRQGLEPQVGVAVSRLMSSVDLDYGTKVRVTLRGYEVVGTEIPASFRAVRVRFVTPAVFVDPFRGKAEGRAKRFLPFPGVVFSVNVYELFRKKYMRGVLAVSHALIESHTALDTAKRVWYYYDGKWLPGVVGYVKYFLRQGADEGAREAVREVLRDAAEMGVGSGRAAGFGFVRLEFS